METVVGTWDASILGNDTSALAKQVRFGDLVSALA
jgi:hypothetical protein